MGWHHNSPRFCASRCCGQPEKMAFFRVDRGRETAVWRAILACRRSRWSCIPGNRISGGMPWWTVERCPTAGNGSVRRRAFCFRFGRCRKSFAASSLPVSMTCASRGICLTFSIRLLGKRSSKTFTPTTGWSMPSNRSAGRKPCWRTWAVTPIGWRFPMSASSALPMIKWRFECGRMPRAGNARCACRVASSSPAFCCMCCPVVSSASGIMACSRQQERRSDWPPARRWPYRRRNP